MVNNKFLLVILLLLSTLAFSTENISPNQKEIDLAKSKCKKLGLKEKTDAFGLCILDAMSIEAATLPKENLDTPSSSWKYKYEMKDINGNITGNGFVQFNISKDENGKLIETSHFEINGNLHSSKFDATNKAYEGNVLYDIANQTTREVFLQFSPYLNEDITQDINPQNKFPKTNFPVYSFHNDYAWTFFSELRGSEMITIKGKNINANKVVLNGFRPTGPGHCMFAQPGIINIDSWYVPNTKRFIKQIIKQFHCPLEYNRLLTEETYELIEN